MLNNKNHFIIWLLSCLLCFSNSASVLHAEEAAVSEEEDIQEISELNAETENESSEKQDEEAVMAESDSETADSEETKELYENASETEEEMSDPETSEEVPDEAENEEYKMFETDPNGLDYSINNNEVTITGYSGYWGGGVSIEIPSKIDGKTVTKIGDWAFGGDSELLGIKIPDTVVSIGEAAFMGCSGMTEITIPASVKSIGDSAFLACSGLTAITIPESVENIGIEVFSSCVGLLTAVIENKVIGQREFSYCTNLTTVTLKDGVTVIGIYAFDECTNLTGISLPGSVSVISEGAFWNCSSLSDITIPDGVESIGRSAFGECVKLTSITIPDSVTSLGKSVFNHCESLSAVQVGTGVQAIDGYVFGRCTKLTEVILPDGLTEIGDGVFSECTSLSKIILPDSVASIGDSAFYRCSKLSDITFSSGLKEIHNVAFRECTGLIAITLPAKLEKIGSDVFAGCQNLTRVTIPASITEAGYDVFSECEKLEKAGPVGSDANIQIDFPAIISGDIYRNLLSSVTSITIPDNVTELGEEAFAFCKNLTNVLLSSQLTTIGKFAFLNCSSLTDVVIPDSVNRIEEGAFYNCKLTSLTIPDSVVFLGGQSFGNNPNLCSVSLPNNLTAIGFAAFADCTNLESISVPKSIKYINSAAFLNCTNLKDVYYYGTSADWSNIQISNDNDALLNAEIHYMGEMIIPVDSVSFQTDHIEIKQHEKLKINVVIAPANATNKNVTFVSENPEIAEIDENGNITGISEGTAVITVITEDGNKTAQCVVSVLSNEIHIEGLETSYAYTGIAINPEIEVYDNGILLTPKTDYTVTYKNTAKAYKVIDPENPTAADKKKAPQIIIKSNSKGNYTGSKTVYFSIEPLDINNEQITVDALSVQATGKTLSPVPAVYLNGKKLKAKTDYIVDYTGWDRLTGDENNEAVITVIAKENGNFSGERKVTVYVAPNASTVSVSKLKVTAAALKYEDLTEENFAEKVTEAITVKDGKTLLYNGINYIIKDIYPEDRAVGSFKVTLEGNDSKYIGERTVTVKIAGIALSDKKVKELTGLSYPYTGEEVTFTPATHLVSYNGKDLTEGTDYVIDSYTKNLNAGTATVTLKGINSYSGTKKVTFKITPVDATGKNIIVEDAYYTKGGSKPKVTVEGLSEGTDYTLKYADNKKVTDGSVSKWPTVTITFKGNYKGTVRRDFFIDPKPLDLVTITAKDKVYSAKANAWKSAPVLKDTDGKTLKAGTDYEKTITYTTVDGKELPAVVGPETVVLVTVTGKGNYTDTVTTTYRILDTGKDISKMTFKIANKEYTGSPVTLSEDDILSIKIGKTEQNLTLGTDYEIASYTNNIKKGTAKVTFSGKGDYGGEKTVSFKIGQRNISTYWNGIMSFFSTFF
ncbi:MAG: leucine-rich repeat protein [Solobacterium sp.]|nr:leucine-rich repeat protein [Solobacterium sp.]